MKKRERVKRIQHRAAGGFVIETVIRESPRRLMGLTFHQGIPFPIKNGTLFFLNFKRGKSMKHFEGMKRLHI